MVRGSAPQARQAAGKQRVTLAVGTGCAGAQLSPPLHGGFPETPLLSLVSPRVENFPGPGTLPEPPLSAESLPQMTSSGLRYLPKVC